MKWLQLTVNTTTEFSDIVSLCMMEQGSEGVNVRDSNDIREILAAHNWDYADDALLSASDTCVYVTGYFPSDYQASVLASALQAYACGGELCTGSLEITQAIIDSEDWENEWRKYYKPIPIKNIVIVPQWLNYREEGKTTVRLDPGMAFGTGNHETTSMCVDLLQAFSVKHCIGADIGCGSGILGICALKLGAEKCFFIDIDEQAIQATAANCALNDVSSRAEIARGDLLQGVGCTLDFAVANITADILLQLLPQIHGLLKENGRLVISGLINSRADEVCSAYETLFTLCKRQKAGEWQAMYFQKK